MNKRKGTVKFLCLLVCLLVLTGCDRSAKERDKALAEAERAKAELARAEATLEEIQNERDELKDNLAIISENWEKANSELISITQAHDDLLNQIDELTNERNSAIGLSKDTKEQIERLSKQLQEKTKESQEYQEWVKELQVTIEDLELQIQELSEQPVEQLEDEEVADGNNV